MDDKFATNIKTAEFVWSALLDPCVGSELAVKIPNSIESVMFDGVIKLSKSSLNFETPPRVRTIQSD